jgi:hypothetical protein
VEVGGDSPKSRMNEPSVEDEDATAEISNGSHTDFQNLSTIFGTKEGTDGWYKDPQTRKVGFFLVRPSGAWSLIHGPYEEPELVVSTSILLLNISAMQYILFISLRPSVRYLTKFFALLGLHRAIQGFSG